MGAADSTCSHSSVPAHTSALVRSALIAVTPYEPGYENDR